MDRRVKLLRHGVSATLLPLAANYWRISIDDGRGGQFEHTGSRESAENRAGWECWCYQRVSEDPPMFTPGHPQQRTRSPDLVSAYFDQDTRAADRRAVAP